jgi:hypothetical protein
MHVILVRFQILTTMTMKNTISCNVTPCNLVEIYWRFAGTYCLRIQSRRVGWESKQQARSSVNFCQTIRRHILDDTATCRWAWLIRRVLDRIAGLIDTLFPQIGSTGNYSAIADLHTLQFIVTHAPGSSVFTSRIPGTKQRWSLLFTA